MDYRVREPCEAPGGQGLPQNLGPGVDFLGLLSDDVAHKARFYLPPFKGRSV